MADLFKKAKKVIRNVNMRESEELLRRANKRKDARARRLKLNAYKTLAKGDRKPIKLGKFSKKKYLKAIDNPYY